LSRLRTKATKERDEHKAAGGGCASLDDNRLDLISIMLIESKSSLYCFSGQSVQDPVKVVIAWLFWGRSARTADESELLAPPFESCPAPFLPHGGPVPPTRR
jgi:hypothetical protein